MIWTAASCHSAHPSYIFIHFPGHWCLGSLNLPRPMNNTVMKEPCSCFSFICDYHQDWYSRGWIAESQGYSRLILLSTTSLLFRITKPVHIPASSAWEFPLSTFSSKLVLSTFLIFVIWWMCSCISLMSYFNLITGRVEHCTFLFCVLASLSKVFPSYFLLIAVLDYLPFSHWFLISVFQIRPFVWILSFCLTVRLSRLWFIQDSVRRLKLPPKYPIHTSLHGRSSVFHSGLSLPHLPTIHWDESQSVALGVFTGFSIVSTSPSTPFCLWWYLQGYFREQWTHANLTSFL